MTLCERCGNYPNICGCAEADALAAQLADVRERGVWEVTSYAALMNEHVALQGRCTYLAARLAEAERELAEVRKIQQRTEGNATLLHMAMYEWVRDRPTGSAGEMLMVERLEWDKYDGMNAAPDGEFVTFKDYDALVARLAEAERDAARYRWLRDSPVEEVDCALLDRIPTEWDAAIDAARATNSASVTNEATK